MLYTEFITQKNINVYKNKKLSKNQSLSINMTIFCAEKSIISRIFQLLLFLPEKSLR